MRLSDLVDDELVAEVMISELRHLLKFASDEVVIGSIHVLIAYHSIPGTYMEGAYDSHEKRT